MSIIYQNSNYENFKYSFKIIKLKRKPTTKFRMNSFPKQEVKKFRIKRYKNVKPLKIKSVKLTRPRESDGTKGIFDEILPPEDNSPLELFTTPVDSLPFEKFKSLPQSGIKIAKIKKTHSSKNTKAREISPPLTTFDESPILSEKSKKKAKTNKSKKEEKSSLMNISTGFGVNNDLNPNAASFRIRPQTPRIDLLQLRNKDSRSGNNSPKSKEQYSQSNANHALFANLNEKMQHIVETDEFEDFEDLNQHFLCSFLNIIPEALVNLNKIEFTIDGRHHNLQRIGECLPNLLQLKLANSVIQSPSQIGTTFTSLKVLYISRVGLKNLSG
jgi:hypothetical protein